MSEELKATLQGIANMTDDGHIVEMVAHCLSLVGRLEADAGRYQWLRQEIKTKAGLVNAQALLWNAAPERKRLDRIIDSAIDQPLTKED